MGRRGKNEGSISYDKSKKLWRGQYKDGRDENGKIIRKNIYSKDKNEVIRRLNTIMYEKANNTYSQRNGIKLIEVIDSIIEQKYKLNIIQDRQYRTLKAHSNRIKEDKIANMKIQEIEVNDIQEFLYTIVDYSQSYIKKLYTLLNWAFKDCFKKRIIQTNPLDFVTLPKSKKDTKIVRSLTLREQKLFTNYLINSSITDEPYKNIFLIQMYLGLRIGEVLALKNSDFDLENDYLYVRRTLTEDKNGKQVMKNKTKSMCGQRDLKISSYLKPYILEQIRISNTNKEGLLFTINKKYIRHHGVNSVLKRIFRTNLGLSDDGISTHILRHTYATRCKESGVDVLVTKELMGHSDVKITLNTYTQIQEKYKVDEIKKFNEFIEDNISFKPSYN